MIDNRDWSYNILTSGAARHLRAVSIPLTEYLENEQPGKELVDPRHSVPTSPLHMQQSYSNSLTAMEALFGISLFLGGWGVKQILDDIYDVKIRPKFRALLGENLPEISQPPSGFPAPQKHYCAVLLLWHENEEKGILVAAVGRSPQELLVNEEAIVRTHIAVEDEMECLDEGNTILLYVVENGVAGDAQQFGSLKEAIGQLSLPRK